MAQTTYVTSFMKIYNNPYNNRDDAYYLSKFEEIANTGINICVYTDNTNLFKNYNWENIKIFETNLKETWVYQTVKQNGGCSGWDEYDNCIDRVNECEIQNISLPYVRNIEKDIANYMVVMNSKIDFVKDAIDKNPFNTSHFAWIDFGITYIFKNIFQCQELLRLYALLKLNSKFLCIPGCLGKTPINDLDAYINRVNWRFCGGFFIGDKESIQTFHSLHRDFFPQFLKEHKTLVWEVNFWAWLEAYVSEWNPTWFQADHNDSIIEIPTKFYAVSLKMACCGVGDEEKEGYKRFTYDYPKIDGFIPSSASHFYVVENETGYKKHFINTRYVNYTIAPDGWYLFQSPEKKIITRNMLSILNTETMVPKCYWWVNEDETGIERKNGVWIEGMEDIRLFQREIQPTIDGITTIDFIATSVNYSNNSHNRMIIGNYEVDENNGRSSLKNCRVLPSPYKNAGCEKNWIPIGSDGSFIYKWSPLEIISLTDNINKEQTWKTNIIEINTPIFKKFRGSTIFIDSGDEEFLGIVHFTEGDGSNKCYFHCFVAINKKTMKPERYSQPFYFEKKGIEYCIGFYIQKVELTSSYVYSENNTNLNILTTNKYYFWISQMDRNPLMIVTDVPNFKWLSLKT